MRSALSILLLLVFAAPAAAIDIAGLFSGPRHLLVLAFDGVSRDGLIAAEAIGKYPALSLFVRDGLHFDHCYTALPSCPERALFELLTGLDGTARLPARVFRREGQIRRFALEDRALFRIPGNPPTLFDHLRQKGLAIGSPIARGAIAATFADFDALPRLVTDAGERHDRAMLTEFFDYAADSLPRVGVLVFSEPAYTFARTGRYGFESAYARVDRILASVVLYIKDRCLLDETLIVLAGLPALPEATRRVELISLLARKTGLRILAADGLNFGAGYPALGARPDLLLCPNGRANLVYSSTLEASTMLGTSTADRTGMFLAPGVTVGVFTDLLVSRPETEMLLYPSGKKRVRVVTKAGSAEISWHLGGFHYRIERGTDPFRFTDNRELAKAIGATVFSPGVWLRATGADPYPGAPVLARELFEGPAAPALLYVMKPGYALAGTDAPGTYGGLSRDEVLAPVIFYRAGIPAGRIEVSRIRDILPTLLSAFGERTALDGRRFDVKWQ